MHTQGRPRRALWKPRGWFRLLEFFKDAAQRVSKFIEFGWTALGLLARSLVLVFSVGVIIYSYKELTSDMLIIEPIAVPKQYADMGIGPEVMANRIKDSLNDIEETASTTVQKNRVAMQLDMLSAPDVEVPGTKIGLKTAIEILRNVVPFAAKRKSVSGEIIQIPGSSTLSTIGPSTGQNKVGAIQITIRIKSGENTSEPPVASVTTNDSKVIAENIAEATLREVNPYVLAVYLYDRGERDRAFAIADRFIRGPYPDRRHESVANNFWGIELADQRKYDEAIAKFQKAID